MNIVNRIVLNLTLAIENKLMKHMRNCILLLAIIICQQLFPQGFKIKSFVLSTTDLSATIHPKEDEKGNVCGLIKVLSNIKDLEFEGSVIGKVENKMNEYWVYLPKGTQDLIISRPNYLPTSISLRNYGFDAIDTKTTYLLTLTEQNLKPEKYGLDIHVKPTDADVKIDGISLKPNREGGYKLFLPKGEHLCSFSAKGHKSSVQSVLTGKGHQSVEINLESIWADLYVTCQNTAAEIFIDNESKGIGGWKGKILPGDYLLEIREDGYLPISKRITLAEKDKKTIPIPALQAIVEDIDVVTTPTGGHILLDGNELGQSPYTLTNVNYGKHHIQLKFDSCGFKREENFEIVVDGKVKNSINHKFITAAEFKYYQDAYELFRKGRLKDPSGQGGDTPFDHPEARILYDNILGMIDHLDSCFFNTIVYFPEYAFNFDALDEPYLKIGSEMWGHYGYIIDNLEIVLSQEYSHYDERIIKVTKEEAQKLRKLAIKTDTCYYQTAKAFRINNDIESAIELYRQSIDHWERKHSVLSKYFEKTEKTYFFNSWANFTEDYYNASLRNIIDCLLMNGKKNEAIPYYKKYIAYNQVYHNWVNAQGKAAFSFDDKFLLSEIIGDLCLKYGDKKDAATWYKRGLAEVQKFSPNQVVQNRIKTKINKTQ